MSPSGLLALGLTLAGPSRAAGAGAPGVAVPLYVLGEACGDLRFPTLAGPWAVGCGPDGRVDRAISLATGKRVDLAQPLEQPGAGPGVLFQPGRGGGFVRLGDGGAVVEVEDVILPAPTVADAVSDGEHVAVLTATHALGFPAAERVRTLHAAAPAGWYPPALAWPWLAWVQDGGDDGEDVVIVDASARDEPSVLAGGPGHQRHVVGASGRLAWVEANGDLVVWEAGTGRRARHAAGTGFNAPPTLWEDVACWETRGADVDIACSDGVAITGAGHQTWPARWDRWLLYREGERVMLYTLPDTAAE